MEIERLGPYNIVGKLGRGGMGTVYEAVHRETGEAAAIKLLSPSLAQEEGFRVRFEAEIETLRKLNHPNIVRLIGFGQQEEHLFYAMELVDGPSLEDALRQGRRFEWREVAQMGIEMCRALRHAHDRGIIHRDIKPANLLLTADGHVKLSDFGIARLFGYTRLTAVGNVVGTAEYMAPEQAEGQPVDARSDLYSLGALLYALLARRPVFRGKSLPEVLHKQRFEKPEPLRTYAADAPEAFEQVLSQLLEKEPGKRIPTATVLGRRLEAMLQSHPSGQETMEANTDWFVEDEPAPESALATLLPLPEDSPVAPTIDRPVGLGPTSVLPEPSSPAPSPRKPQTIEIAAKEPTKEISPEPARPVVRNHFVPVGEHELDPAAEEESQPLISWQTVALAIALLLVGLSVWWFLQPPSANALFDRIESRMAAESPLAQPRSASEIAEVSKVVSDFNFYYSSDPRREQIREWEEELKLRQRRCEFEQRISSKTATLSPVEQMYLEAISYERLNPTHAAAQLQALLDLYNHSNGKKSQNEANQSCLAAARLRLEELQREVGRIAGAQLVAIGERLDEADSLREKQRDRATVIYRAVVQLYSDKPWAAKAVARAQKALDEK